MEEREKGVLPPIRVDNLQRELFEAAAEADGLTLSEWVRQALRATAIKRLGKKHPKAQRLAEYWGFGNKGKR